MYINSQLHTPASSHPAEEPLYRWVRRLDGSQSRSYYCLDSNLGLLATSQSLAWLLAWHWYEQIVLLARSLTSQSLGLLLAWHWYEQTVLLARSLTSQSLGWLLAWHWYGQTVLLARSLKATSISRNVQQASALREFIRKIVIRHEILRMRASISFLGDSSSGLLAADSF
jgi:hypothetical protein